ncbi:MAG: hypothetical protein K2I94_03770 [Muribaculaceae bacterium]|nr:hypothetical protein [Muribaculaceae bacterium]
MGRIKRFITAPLRLRTSRGFGVHSPFAFSFIINVLKQHDSFYSYSTQNKRTVAARNYAQNLPTKSLQHLIFRICNRFHPDVVFEIGHSSGLEAMAVLDYSSNCKLMSYDNRQPSELFINITERSKDRITIVPNFRIGIEQYNNLTTESTPLVVVNQPKITTPIVISLSQYWIVTESHYSLIFNTTLSLKLYGTKLTTGLKPTE